MMMTVTLKMMAGVAIVTIMMMIQSISFTTDFL